MGRAETITIYYAEGETYPMSLFIDKLLKRLPQARDSFYTNGVELPRLFLSDVEAARVRSGDEHDYQYYMDEALREKAMSKHPWPSDRDLIKPDQRSAYLDMLSVRYPSETASLDPNFNRFMKLDDDIQIARLGKYRDQKQKEQEQHAAELTKLVGTSSLSLVNGIIRIAEQFGYTSKQKNNARSASIELECVVPESAQLLIRLPDMYALKKHGFVTVQYYFAEMPDECFGLSSFLPGGYYYDKWNDAPGAVFFSFYVNCKFLSYIHKL